MATWIGLGTGLVYIAAGWAIYVFAPKIGPNPVFGVRTWYSMVSEEVWNQSNRVGGILFALIGALVVPWAILSRFWIDPDSDAGILTVVGIDMALTFTGVIWLVLYTRQLAKGVQIQSIGIIRVSFVWLLPGALLTVAILAFLLATSSTLPADSVATHFDLQGEANDWMSRSSYLWFSGGAVLGTFSLLSCLFLVLTHVPIPGATTWPVSGEPVMHFLAGMLVVVEAEMGATFLEVYWFNTRAEHLLTVSVFTLLILGVTLVGAVAGIAHIVVYGRRIRRQRT